MDVTSIEQSAPLSELPNSNLFSNISFLTGFGRDTAKSNSPVLTIHWLILFFVLYIVSIHKQSKGSTFVSTMKRNYSDSIFLLNYDIKVITNYLGPSLILCA